MTTPYENPAYEIRTERLSMRCWEPTDTPLLLASLERNREHLSTWLSWAKHEPLPVEEKLTWLRERRAKFDLGEDFSYGIFDINTGRLLGALGMHTRCGPGGLELGYWTDQDTVGRGIATEAAGAATRVAFEVLGVQRVEIRVSPGNEASVRIPEKLGFFSEGRLRNRIELGDGWTDLISYCLTLEDYPKGS